MAVKIAPYRRHYRIRMIRASPKHARGCARRVNKSNRAVRRPVAGNLHRATDVIPGGRAPGRPQRRIRPGSARSTAGRRWLTARRRPQERSRCGDGFRTLGAPTRARVTDAEDSGGRQTTPVRGYGSDHGELNRPVAMPGRDRPGWRQPTAVPNLQSGAARRGSRRCTPTRLRHREQTLGRASRSVC